MHMRGCVLLSLAGRGHHVDLAHLKNVYDQARGNASPAK